MSIVRTNRCMIFCYLLFIIILVDCGPMVDIAHSQPPLETKNVLILNGAEPNTPAFVRLNQELLTVLQSGGIGIRNQFYEHLGLTRNPSPESRKLKMQLVSLRYSKHKMDLIITLYPNGLKFLLDMDQSFFPDAPVMALIIPQAYKLPETDRRIIPHVVVPDLNRTLEIGLDLVPKAERVYVVNGVDPIDRWIGSLARKAFKEWEDRLDFQYLNDLPLGKVLATVSAAPANSIVYLTTFSKDVTGEYYRTVEVSEDLAQVSKAPVFGLLGSVIGHGNVGGSLISFKHIGTKAGELALDILRGAQNIENIPEVLKVPQMDIFDWHQLKHWGLSESDLPEGSDIVNREFTLWDLRYYMVGILVFIIAQSLLITGLLVQKRQKRSAEEALRKKSEELNQFFNVSIELLCIINANGYFFRFNPAWETVLGYSREELMGHRLLDLVHPDDIVRTQEAASALVSQGKIVHFENRYQCKDGTYRQFKWNAAQVGNLIYAVANDLTEYINAETKAKQHRDKLAHLTRVATMGELTTSLAHEINQPLTAVRSNAEAARRFLLQTEPDIDEVREIFEDIIQDNKRASDIVQKIRALVKKEKPNEINIDLNRIIQELLALIRSESILKGLTITTDLFPELMRINGDSIQLQQVVLNLMLNGAAAMAHAPIDRRKIIVRTTMQDNKTVKVSVTDFGTGIDESTIEQIFDAFYTTKAEGMGMGLSISQTIIDAHGGEMKASNHQEGGATFVLTLPVGKEIRHE